MSNDKLATLIQKLFEKDKSVIESIKEFGIKDFYYKFFKTVNDAYLYQKTGYIDQEWKKGLAKHLMNYDLKKILLAFDKVESNGYFREDWCNFCFVNAFFEGDQINGIHKVVEGSPSRSSRVLA